MKWNDDDDDVENLKIFEPRSRKGENSSELNPTTPRAIQLKNIENVE